MGWTTTVEVIWAEDERRAAETGEADGRRESDGPNEITYTGQHAKNNPIITSLLKHTRQEILRKPLVQAPQQLSPL